MAKPSFWLSRELTTCAVYYCLCLDEKEFHAELKHCGIPQSLYRPFLVSPRSHAAVHYYSHGDKELAFVCLGDTDDRTGVQIAALLCHEAVHIWQHHAGLIGAGNDHGDEEEAYAIQAIAQALMQSFAERRVHNG